jgi:hypothetical protein
MSSCIPWLSKIYTTSDIGDCGNVDTDSDNSVKSCPSEDSEEDRRRRQRWLSRGRLGSKNEESSDVAENSEVLE